MSAVVHCCQPVTRTRRIFRDAASTTSLGLALLLPKCPMCVLAWAAAFGVGATLQRWLVYALDPTLRPVLIALLATTPLVLRLSFALRHLFAEKRKHA